jgi:hypothetical protein
VPLIPVPIRSTNRANPRIRGPIYIDNDVFNTRPQEVDASLGELAARWKNSNRTDERKRSMESQDLKLVYVRHPQSRFCPHCRCGDGAGLPGYYVYPTWADLGRTADPSDNPALCSACVLIVEPALYVGMEAANAVLSAMTEHLHPPYGEGSRT